ncbi:TIGR01619 family protein [Haemophilus haemoglobinophilus]|nr:TIGR01619 family protein [Canicola haemoglobinophilus]
MGIGQEWQNYRTKINDKLAIFSVNLELLEQFLIVNHICEIVVQFDVPYIPDHQGLPQMESYASLQQDLLKISTLISAQNNVYYAGNILCNGKATLYFYCNDALDITDILDDNFPQAVNIEKQFDSTWDLYFDFLMASSADLKVNETEELLTNLIKDGKDVSKSYQIEHIFYFFQENDLYLFLEHVSASDISFVSLKHSPNLISVDGYDRVYIAKIEQDLYLNDTSIYQYIRMFDELALLYSGEYVGWDSEDIGINKSQLN